MRKSRRNPLPRLLPPNNLSESEMEKAPARVPFFMLWCPPGCLLRRSVGLCVILWGFVSFYQFILYQNVSFLIRSRMALPTT